jgi:hypothetical protein
METVIQNLVGELSDAGRATLKEALIELPHCEFKIDEDIMKGVESFLEKHHLAIKQQIPVEYTEEENRCHQIFSHDLRFDKKSYLYYFVIECMSDLKQVKRLMRGKGTIVPTSKYVRHESWHYSEEFECWQGHETYTLKTTMTLIQVMNKLSAGTDLHYVLRSLDSI